MDQMALRALMSVRNLSQAELARAAGVSRQAVSSWLKSRQPQGDSGSSSGCRTVQIRADTLRNLSEKLQVSYEFLVKRFPLADNPAMRRNLTAEFLWDALYPSLEDFAVAIIRGEFNALARLTQGLGLCESAALAGRLVWRKYPRFKKYLLPQRRAECEQIWNLQTSLGLI